MIRILLIRHANAESLGSVLYGRMPGIHLNSEGVRQAQSVGQALKARFKLSQVISSPLERALETARWIAEPQNVPISTDEGITEINFGSWTGRPFAELRESADWKRYNRFRSITSPPGGEFMTDVQVRGWRSLEGILARNRNAPDPSIAVVSHGDVVRSLLLLLLGVPIDYIHRIEVAPASVSEALLGMHEPIIKSVNQLFY
jgi:broad specificity phosphatase PhoE